MSTSTTDAPTRRLAARYTDSLFGVLDRDWAATATSRHARRRLQAWIDQHRQFAPFATLEDLDRHLDRLTGSDVDPYLYALLVEAHAGDPLATRTLIHRFRYLAVGLARRFRDRYDSEEDANAAVLAALCQQIARYPLARRPVRIAANLSLDTLKQLHRATRRPTVPTGALHGDPAVIEQADHPAIGLTRLLDDAVAARRLDPAAARLVAITTLADTPQRDVARQLGVCDRQIRRRLRQAVTTLSELAAA